MQEIILLGFRDESVPCSNFSFPISRFPFPTGRFRGAGKPSEEPMGDRVATRLFVTLLA